jgi:hypothetical protein
LPGETPNASASLPAVNISPPFFVAI